MKLTKNQQLLLDLEKVSGGSINVICGSVFFDKPADTEKMAEAVNELFRINDALRIKLIKSNGKISQEIQEFKEKSIEIIHVSDKKQAHEYAQAQAKLPFDIFNNLCEIRIFDSSSFSGILYKLHHIIADAWTLSLIATQFNEILNGKNVESYSYSSHIEDDINYLESKRYQKDKDFYIEQFKKQPEPVFISDIEAKTLKAKRKTFNLDINLIELLRNFSKVNNISFANIFLAVVSVYYSRIINNAQNFYIGLPVINRKGPIEKNTAGLYINTAPILIEADKDMSFNDFLLSVESNVLSVMRHQKYTYEDISTSLNNNFGFSGKLFDLIFSYQNAIIQGESFESTWYNNGMQRESLQIHVDDRDNTGILKIHYDYQIEKFNEKEIDRLHSCVCQILESAIENPEKKTSELNMLSEKEKQKILFDFNNTYHLYQNAENSTLYSLFEKTASENHNKICITTTDSSITFGELLKISSSLDEEIRNITHSQKSIIAVIAERSIEMYSAIYGIIRGGNSYLPIDPEYPKERIEYILNNSGAKAVIIQNKFIHLVKNSVPYINMTEFLNRTFDATTVEPLVAPEDTAYVIYTSGSTGKPKGAKISHRSAINRILWMHNKYPLKENDVILQKTPYTFDVSVWELFWWSIYSGKLVASKPGEHFLPAKILEETELNQVTHLHFVPSVFEVFLNYIEKHPEAINKFLSVRYVFLSGEALNSSLVKKFYTFFDYKKVTLHNLYGPTECTVDVSFYDCNPNDIDPIPIGKPIHNTQLFVVDRFMNLQPIGIKGELCIGGLNVGQGYLNNAELTSEKFVVNPFGKGKLYKTGDLAYWNEDGNIIFTGRMDSQIKLNGQRIEIGEIESVIKTIEEVESVAVIVNKSTSNDTLVAFYSGKSGYESLIKNICSEKLAKYMIPATIIHLDKLPLNASGKLDKKLLSSKQIDIVDSVEDNVPINAVELFICETFKNVLNRDNISRNSDFFDCGGTSLSMISLLSEDQFKNITAADFMKNSTPAKLALIIQNKQNTTFEYIEPIYVPENHNKALILLPFAGGGAEAYLNFISSYREFDKETAIYFIRYLHSFEECDKAAFEIAKQLNEMQIYFYSHCVGSAVALKIIKKLEIQKVNVAHYFIGASIPPLKPTQKNIWNKTPDTIINLILSKAGADIKGLSKKKNEKMLINFRKDTDFANLVYYNFDDKLESPVSIIISKKDMFTLNYKKAKDLWKKYCKSVKNIYYIDSKSHYFQSENSKSLAEFILNIINK